MSFLHWIRETNLLQKRIRRCFTDTEKFSTVDYRLSDTEIIKKNKLFIRYYYLGDYHEHFTALIAGDAKLCSPPLICTVERTIAGADAGKILIDVVPTPNAVSNATA